MSDRLAMLFCPVLIMREVNDDMSFIPARYYYAKLEPTPIAAYLGGDRPVASAVAARPARR